jgi:hypothetical protein
LDVLYSEEKEPIMTILKADDGGDDAQIGPLQVPAPDLD